MLERLMTPIRRYLDKAGSRSAMDDEGETLIPLNPGDLFRICYTLNVKQFIKSIREIITTEL